LELRKVKQVQVSVKIKPYFFLTIICSSLLTCLGSSDCFRENVFCAALVTDTLGVEDHGVNQDAWVGLQESDIDQIEYIESVDSRDYQKNIDYFAAKGFDVIITSGIGLQDETLLSADLYPDTTFIGINQPEEEPRSNLINLTFSEDQMGFAAGTLAAKLSKTGVVAGICETSGIDSMWRYCEGFRAGTLFTNPEIKVFIAYRDDGDREKLFIDEAWGYETASSLIAQGADMVFSAGGVTGQGALKAATDLNIYAIGTERNQFAALAESGNSVLTSFYGQTSFEVKELMRLIQEGNASGARIGQIQFVPLNQTFPESLSFEIEFLLTMLGSGEIYTNIPFEKP
jgi:basic membrane protein A and related proteins